MNGWYVGTEGRMRIASIRSQGASVGTVMGNIAWVDQFHVCIETPSTLFLKLRPNVRWKWYRNSTLSSEFDAFFRT